VVHLLSYDNNIPLVGSAVRAQNVLWNVSSLPILEKGEQFPRVICILALLCSHYIMSFY
jgi:hypothetical protein